MKVLQLTKFAKARIWFGDPDLGSTFSGSVCRHVQCEKQVILPASQVVLEILIPRGAMCEYGLLGLAFEDSPTGVLEIEVQYSAAEQAPWAGSLAAQVDDVHLGLPFEYSNSILEVASSQASKQFRSGKLKVVEAAHGRVGSSSSVFGRLTSGVQMLMHAGALPDVELATLLRGALLGP